MKKIKSILITLLLANFMLLAPIGNQGIILASEPESECTVEFQENVQDCTEIYPAENPITGFFQVICIIASGVEWVVCEIATLLQEA